MTTTSLIALIMVTKLNKKQNKFAKELFTKKQLVIMSISRLEIQKSIF